MTVKLDIAKLIYEDTTLATNEKLEIIKNLNESALNIKDAVKWPDAKKFIIGGLKQAKEAYKKGEITKERYKEILVYFKGMGNH